MSGWLRLWVAACLLWAGFVAYEAHRDWKALDEDIAGRLVTRANIWSELPPDWRDRSIWRRLTGSSAGIAQENWTKDSIAAEAVLAERKTERTALLDRATRRWGLPSLLALVVGLLAAWVVRGFRRQ